jgi:steroid delta-isomerase-like uncharacterized protein
MALLTEIRRAMPTDWRRPLSGSKVTQLTFASQTKRDNEANRIRRLSMSTEENKAVIRRWFREVINGANAAVVDELAAPNYTNPEGYDRAGVKAMVAGMKTGIPDARLDVENLVAEGDAVVARFTMTGTHTGSMMGETPTGKKFSTRGMAFFRLANGRIVEDESIATPNLADVLGLTLPAAASA